MVLDTSALVAVVRKEAGADLVRAAIDEGAIMSTVNLSETFAVLTRYDFTQSEIEDAVTPLPISYEEFQSPMAIAAGMLYPRFVGKNVSFADRACIALGIVMGLPVMTGDRPWAKLDLDGNPEVILIR